MLQTDVNVLDRSEMYHSHDNIDVVQLLLCCAHSVVIAHIISFNYFNAVVDYNVYKQMDIICCQCTLSSRFKV